MGKNKYNKYFNYEWKQGGGVNTLIGSKLNIMYQWCNFSYHPPNQDKIAIVGTGETWTYLKPTAPYLNLTTNRWIYKGMIPTLHQGVQFGTLNIIRRVKKAHTITSISHSSIIPINKLFNMGWTYKCYKYNVYIKKHNQKLIIGKQDIQKRLWITQL